MSLISAPTRNPPGVLSFRPKTPLGTWAGRARSAAPVAARLGNTLAGTLRGAFPAVLFGIFFGVLLGGLARAECIDYRDYLHWIGEVGVPGSPSDVALAGSHAYIAADGQGLQVVDISDPASPRLVGHAATQRQAVGVAVAGSYAYAAEFSGLQVIDVSDPASPHIAGSVETPDYARRVAVSGGYAYVAEGFLGLQVIDVSDPASPQIVGTVDTPGFAWDVALSGDYALLADHDFGLQVIDVSNPAAPQITGSVDTPGYATSVAAVGVHAYVADGTSGFHIVDLSDPSSPQIVGSVDTPDNAYGVTVVGGYAYVADYSGLVVIDVSDPVSPQILGGVATPGLANGVAVAGPYAYVADGDSGLQIVDVSDPASPRIVGSVDLPDQAFGVAVAGSHAYVAGWSFGMHVIDVSDPASPQVVGIVDTPDQCFGAVVAGDQVFLADGDLGLRVAPTQCPPPPEPIHAFSLLLPADGDSILTRQATLLWRAARALNPEDTLRYTIFWTEDLSRSIADSVEAGTDTTYTFHPDSLHILATYHWRVKAWNRKGEERASDPPGGWSFYVLGGDTPCRIQPEAVVQEDGILLSWRVFEGYGLAGFRLYRRAPGEEWQCISPLLPSVGQDFRYLDSQAEPGVRYEYTVEAIGPDGVSDRFGPVSAELPPAPSLTLRVRSNPSAEVVTLAFTLPRAGDVVFRVFDTLGREVARKAEPALRAGVHRRAWAPHDTAGHRLSSGVYYLRLDAPSGQRTVRWVVLR